MNIIKRKCKHCNRSYIGEGFKDVCTEDCYFKNNYKKIMIEKGYSGETYKEKKLPKLFCENCDEPFQAISKKSRFCSSRCTGANKNKKYKEKILKGNENWLNPKPKKKMQTSFAQLDRQFEWKRVWDDESWTKKFNTYRA